MNNVINIRIGLVAIVEHARFVVLPLAGVDVDTKRSVVGEVVNDWLILVLGKDHVVGEFGERLGDLGIVVALEVLAEVRDVGVHVLRGETAHADDVFVGDLGSGTTAAAGATTLVRVGRAVENLLFGERGDLLRSHCPVRLDGLGSETCGRQR